MQTQIPSGGSVKILGGNISEPYAPIFPFFTNQTRTISTNGSNVVTLTPKIEIPGNNPRFFFGVAAAVQSSGASTTTILSQSVTFLKNNNPVLVLPFSNCSNLDSATANLPPFPPTFVGVNVFNLESNTNLPFPYPTFSVNLRPVSSTVPIIFSAFPCLMDIDQIQGTMSATQGTGNAALMSMTLAAYAL